MVQLKSDIQEYYASKENKPRLSITKKQNASKPIYCNRPYKVAISCLGLGALVFSLSRIMADARIHYSFATILLIAAMPAM